eukprot:2314053-Karenia_brevis.AAC.1
MVSADLVSAAPLPRVSLSQFCFRVLASAELASAVLLPQSSFHGRASAVSLQRSRFRGLASA